MDQTYQASLTPEQLAAITAGGGFARCEDPNTHVHYELVQVDPMPLTDEYIRQKLDEAYADVDSVAPLDMSAIKAELNRRIAARSRSGN
jgi:hypothetical protein